tara:strand:- start:1411 stop:1572 length:162 start_codon:yes stop_codon:yes gene_type:complete
MEPAHEDMSVTDSFRMGMDLMIEFAILGEIDEAHDIRERLLDYVRKATGEVEQ